MNILKKWQSLEKTKRRWIILLTAIALVTVVPRLTMIPTPIPYPKEYPLKNGTFEAGAEAYKTGNYCLALANFIEVAYAFDTRGMSMASRMYYFGEGVQRDICQGTFWADQAARNGDFLSQARLSRAYLSRYGIKEDDEKAYLWAKLAADNTRKRETNEWFKQLTKKTYDAAEWLRYLQQYFTKKELTEFNKKYQQWSYKQEAPVKIIRTRRIPYVGISPVRACNDEFR